MRMVWGQLTWGPDHPRGTHDVVADQSQAYDLYTKWGVPVSPHNRAVTSFQEILDMIEYYGEHRGDIEHALDGIVVKVDDLGCSVPSAPLRARRAGPSPTNTRPKRSTPNCSTSPCRWGVPAV